jgi:hypothetical protein
VVRHELALEATRVVSAASAVGAELGAWTAVTERLSDHRQKALEVTDVGEGAHVRITEF